MTPLRSCALIGAMLASGCAGGSAVASTSSQPGTAPAQPALVFTGPTVPASSSGSQELFISQLDGSGVKQLTNDGTIKFLPHFSPDGRRVLYTKFLTGGYGIPNAVTAVAVFDLTTMTETVLTHGGLGDQPVWSPDGTRILYSTYTNAGLSIMNADGSGAKRIGGPSGAPSDQQWADPLWSSDNWIYFVVEQKIGGCLKTRIDRIRPDGTARTQITDGGPNCTPPGMEQNGDADPGISPDGTTLYSSRGLPTSAPGLPGHTLRHLYAFASTPYVAGKAETDLSAALVPNCIAGVPKVSPDGFSVALFLLCADAPARWGVTLTNASGSSYTFIERGFGADWNPAHSSSFSREASD